jgi:hypothetical protein
VKLPPRALAVGAALALSTGAARADQVSGTRSTEVYERAHDVLLTMHRGWAELRVRRSVENLGKRHDQALFWIDVPRGAVATGLRTLGATAGRPHWFAGELMEAEAAAAKYRELTGIGGYYPKDPALLSWRNQDLLALQVFPVAPADKKTVEYTLRIPTVYEQGAHRLALPGLGTEDLAADVVLAAAPGGDELSIDGRRVTQGARLHTPLGKTAELSLVPKMREPIGGELAVAGTGNGRWVTRFVFEAAPHVEEVPKRASIVVAIDASRSVSSSDLDAAKAATAGYLSHFSDAEVEILTFARTAKRRYGHFVSVKRAQSDLEAMTIEQKNGSNVDAALAEAEKIVAGAPAGRPRRVVLVTDGVVRSSLKPERIRGALGSGSAVVHIGILHAGSDALSRDDQHPWASAVRSTGGLVWNASATSDARDARLRGTYEEWARPMRIDHVRLYSPDIEVGNGIDAPPDTLNEGESITRAFVGKRDVSWVRVEGELWARRVERVARSDAAAAKRWSALVFGSALLDELTEPEMMKLAMRGGAVSPVTSYLAIEPGVRPSTEGLEWGSSGSGFGSGVPRVRMGATSATGRAPFIDRDAWLTAALSQSYQACGGKSGTATLRLETTFAEVVDVPHVELTGPPDALLGRCLTEAAWDLVLPASFDLDWESFTLYL